MQTTFEVRWFLEGTPPAALHHWFESECPGELLTPKAETREDLYAYGDLKNKFSGFKELIANFTGDGINLKLREGNLELKLRGEQFGIKTFTALNNCSIWSGRVEQWRKFDLQPLQESSSNFDSRDFNWIPVYKKRRQKSNRRVESELTELKTEDSAWWTIAFEMTSNNNVEVDFFCEVVQQAAKTYSGVKLLAEDSCSYVHWLNEFVINKRGRINQTGSS